MPTLTTTINIDAKTLYTLEKSMRRGNRHSLEEQIEFILTTWGGYYEALDPTFKEIKERLENAGNENKTKAINTGSNP